MIHTHASTKCTQFYSRAVVKNEKLVSVIEDVMVSTVYDISAYFKLCCTCIPDALHKYPHYISLQANDYVSGEGTKFFSKESFQERWNNQDIGRKQMSESLIAFSVDMSPQEIHELPDAIDLLGDFPEAQAGTVSEGVKMFKGVEILENLLGLGALRPMRNAEDNLYLKSMMPINTVCFRGHTVRKKDGDNKFVVTQNGRGHWGQNIYPGVAAHRIGLSGDGFIKQVSQFQVDF